MHEAAKDPNDLERFFVARANAGDIEGLVALYEVHAALDCGGGEIAVGKEQIVRFFIRFLQSNPLIPESAQSPALISGDLALTSSLLENGDITAEVARRQADGSWLWAIDQFALAKVS